MGMGKGLVLIFGGFYLDLTRTGDALTGITKRTYRKIQFSIPNWWYSY